MSQPDCPFCLIASRDGEATVYKWWPDSVAFVPLNPVTSGHLLVAPRVHVVDALDDPIITAATMARAVEVGRSLGDVDCNLITSVGRAATQTVRHLHIHVVPRRPGDRLMLPWSEVPS